MERSSSDKARDHLANERTFLAWVRTSIALLGFGVVIAKLRFLIAMIPASPGTSRLLPTAGQGGRSLLLGLLFCIAGEVTLLMSVFTYMRTGDMIESGSYAPHRTLIALFAGIVLLLGAASIVFLLQM